MTESEIDASVPIVPSVPKIHLRLSYDCCGLTAQLATPPNELVADEVNLEKTGDNNNSTHTRSYSQKKTNKQYCKVKIARAIEDMKNGMSTGSAAAKWGVARMTLQNRKKGRLQGCDQTRSTNYSDSSRGGPFV